jgi:uncharacterized protein with NRDE domain
VSRSVVPYDGSLVCLLVALFQLDPAAPVVIAANRDEYHARAACAMTTLEADGPGGTIIGGLDHVSGGSWLAVNRAGVVAGLTNRPLPDGPDRAKRTRGELPVRLVRHATAAAAVEAFVDDVRPAEYNPAWLLVGDRTQLFFVDVTGDDGVVVEELGPGVHVLENRGLHEPSAKADRVRALLGADVGVDELAALLADHHQPSTEAPEPEPNADAATATATETPSRLALEARRICVHDPDDGYGTRSSNIITVGRDPSCAPDVRYTDGAPCVAPWHSARELW